MTHNMTRIVGGVDVEANEYPWQVGLVHGPASRKPFCGGTLISDHEVRHRVDIVDIIYVSRC